MRKNELVTKIMTPANKVHTVHLEQKISEVRQLLSDHQIHHVPVLSADVIIGMISATDMLKMTFTAYGGDDRSFDAYLDHEFTIEDVMTKNLTTVTTHTPIREVALTLFEGAFNSLPVVNAEGNFMGLVTTKDLARHVHELYS